MDAAAHAAGRDPATVTLVAVGKFHPPSALAAAVTAGVTDLGENYAQELAAKARVVTGARWHMVGRVQRNKAALVVSTGAVVHSLDSLDLATALARRGAAAGRPVEALVQVESGRGPGAPGVPETDLPAFVDTCRSLSGLRVRGLMVLPPPGLDATAARRVFARCAELAGQLGPDMQDLSMGMSADLELAIAEGATMIRVGTAVFGARPVRPGDPGVPAHA